MSELPEFRSFPKIARLSRECIISEKIDGTNAQIVIKDNEVVAVGSRNRYITPQNDNFGFARWVEQNKEELKKLGDGTHFGEWYGLGIQRGYDLFERRLSLFRMPKACIEVPKCVTFVPILYEGIFTMAFVLCALNELQSMGSKAVPGYMKPEGIVIYHKAAGVMFKKTIEGDDAGKGESNE